jgi:eukaryotic-like serine/threonine-protein kinase
VQSVWLPAIRGQIALNRKDPKDAIRALGAPAQIEGGNIQFVAYGNCLYTVYVRGKAHLATGEGGGAAAQFQRIVDHAGLVDNCWTGALARSGLARAYAIENDKAKAKGADENFLMLWKDADPQIPIYRQAKAEYAKLQ